MPTYESVPSECEADQWTGPGGPVVPGVQVGRTLTGTKRYYVMTAHGQAVYIVAGDVIVKEPNGNGYYPVKPDIFLKRWRLKTVTKGEG